ncbi:MAG: agenet domain-containing protein [Ginsengibacter sp.]|jgi:hypothetical protein
MIKYLFILIAFTLTISANGQQLKIGGKVEVRNSGVWYKATILKTDGDRYRVHFEGYPSSDDVWILRSYIRIVDATGEPTKVTCSFNPPGGNYSNASKPSEALFKKEIYDWYHARVNTASISAPTAIGVQFTSFDIQPAYKNIIIVDAAKRANRKHNGAPVNTLIYTAKTNYIVCERYSSGDSQTQVWAIFSFFKNTFGEWTCSKDQ